MSYEMKKRASSSSGFRSKTKSSENLAKNLYKKVKNDVRLESSRLSSKKMLIDNKEHNSPESLVMEGDDILDSNDPNSLEQLTSKIKMVFDYYCQFGDRLNTNYLKAHKFQKLANDAELFDENFDKIRLELISAVENKHKNPMDFPTFLNCLVKIADYKYKGTPQTRMNILLRNHILPLYSFIYEKTMDQSEMEVNDMNKSCYSHSVNINKLNREIVFDQGCQEILTAAAPILFEIYKVHFPWEISNSENDEFVKENSDRVYYPLLKDFDLSPSLVSRSFAFQIYQSEIVNNFEFNDTYYQIIKNLDIVSLRKYNTTNFLGKYFNFFNFLRMIYKIAENGYEKVSKEFTQVEKLTLTFERMELSKGFNNIDLLTNKTHSKKSSFILPKEVVENLSLKIMDNLHTESKNNELGKDLNFDYNTPSQEHNFSLENRNKVKNYVFDNFQNTNEQSYYILEKYGEGLSNIYKTYCCFGDPLNPQLYLRNPKFTKLLRDAGLIIDSRHKMSVKPPLAERIDPNDKKKKFFQTGLKLNDVDPIFFKLANYNSETQEKSRAEKITREKKSMIVGMFYRKEMGNFEDFYSKRNIINSSAKIDFNTFINAIEVIAALLFPNESFTNAIDKVVKNILTVGNLHESKNSMEPHIEYLKLKDERPELLEILKIIHKTYYPIFLFYAGEEEYLQFENFLKFCTDFSIFPGLFAKLKLNSYFNGFSQCLKISLEDNKTPFDYIDHSLFADIIALCALEVKYRDNNLNIVEKILIFMEKLSQSEGLEKVIKKAGKYKLKMKLSENYDLLNEFRDSYPSYFKIEIKQQEGFFDVMKVGKA